MAGKLILLGHVGAAHGVRGEVSVKTYTGEPDAIGDYGPLTDARGANPLTVASLRPTGKGLIVRFTGVETRTAAEALRGRALYVPRAALPAPDEGDYYHEDLIGLSAVDRAGAVIGNVVAVQNFGAGDLLEIQFKDQRGTEFVPFTDACVPEIDIAGARIVVIPPVMVDDREDATDDGETPPGTEATKARSDR